MKLFCISLIFGIFLLSCGSQIPPIVSKLYIDSLITHYTVPSQVKTNGLEMQFWKINMDKDSTGSFNTQNYANSLIMHYHLTGDIGDLTRADSLIKKVNEHSAKTDYGVTLTLAGFSLLLHRYDEAREWIQSAKTKGQSTVDQKEALSALEFDLYFESGQYDSAAGLLRELRTRGGYPFYFRLSRLKGQKGSIDSAIVYMLKAADLARTNDYLKQLALANAAVFCAQRGDWQKANNLYMNCIDLNPSDFHSIMGLGWISLKQDRDDSLSELIFHFVQSHFLAPDPLYRLSQVEEAKQDEAKEKKYAMDFAALAEDSAYGNIYNKYLIDLYSGILGEPARAEAIAEKETKNRPNPQIFAWYTWTLFKNNKKDEALQVFENYVSGKQLDATESYWMGKFLKAMNKNTEAVRYFESARQKQFDLCPGKLKDLEKSLQ